MAAAKVPVGVKTGNIQRIHVTFACAPGGAPRACARGKALKSLLVHIGCAKGGSSAIQAGLRLNQEELVRRGVAVPGTDLTSTSTVTGTHAAFFESRLQERRATPLPELADLLDETAASANASTVVISAENLSNPNGFEAIFASLADRFDVRILLYVRRQDDFLESAWQQWDVKRGGSLLAWMIRNIRVRGDWCRVVGPWADVFGDERILTRVYDRDLLVGGDVSWTSATRSGRTRLASNFQGSETLACLPC